VRLRVFEGGKKSRLARDLGISVRTARHWARLDRRGDLRAKRRGRPPRRSSVLARQALLQAIRNHGPGIGVQALRRLAPGLGREEVREILARYRAHYLREHEAVLEALEWQRPGAAWAIDHTQSADGRKQTILSVRDLASGAQLGWQLHSSACASDTDRALEQLFLLHGPPLVLKCDNGSAFTAREFKCLCAKAGVEILFSPPRCPRYNGAVGAS
jgi:transposase InsO family protein